MGQPPDTDGTVLASFERPDRAKAAMAALERGGIPHADIELVDDVRSHTRAQARSGDDRKVRWLTRQWAKGALIGALIGIVIAVVLALVIDASGYVTVGAIVGGAVAGAFVGGFVSTGASMPRNPSAWDTYLLDHRDEACVAVRSHGRGGQVAALLRDAGATSIGFVGNPGVDVRDA